MKTIRLAALAASSMSILMLGVGCGGGSGTAATGVVQTTAASLTSVARASGTSVATFVAQRALPSPSSGVASPSTSVAASATPSRTLQIAVVTPAPVDDILIAAPGQSGYFDLNVHGNPPDSMGTYGSSYALVAPLAADDTGLLSLNVSTVTGGVVSAPAVVSYDLTAAPQLPAATSACGGGEIDLAFSQVDGASVDTANTMLSYITEAVGPSASGQTGSLDIFAYPCGYGTTLSGSLGLIVSLLSVPQAGATYPISNSPSVVGGASSITYTRGGSLWHAATGSVTIQTLSNHTMTFTLHASMVPSTTFSEAPPHNPAQTTQGTFTLDASGIAGVLVPVAP